MARGSSGRIIGAWRTDNIVRPHSSLGSMATAEFAYRASHGLENTEASLSMTRKWGAFQLRYNTNLRIV